MTSFLWFRKKDSSNKTVSNFDPKDDPKLDKLILDTAVSDRLLDNRLRVDVRDLRRKFPGFDSAPVEAQQALLDMAFNLG